MRRSRKIPPTGPRTLAALALTEWFSVEPGRRRPLEELADSHLRKAALRQADTGLFWEIVFGSVRWRRLLEWHLKRHLRKLNGLPLPVRMVLLAGSYQIIFLARIPFFAAVNEAVLSVKTLGFPWAKGLVNAVLRKVSSSPKVVPEDERFFEERCGRNFLNCLSVFSSHPHWMVKRWEEQWGRSRTVSICVSSNIHPPLTIRVNSLRIRREEFLSILEKEGLCARRGELSPDAVIVEGFRGRPERIPGFQEGFFQVQDEASQLVSMMLKPEPGLTVLDMCAGVGGKSTHIAALMENRGEILCADANRKRLGMLAENAGRLGIEITKILSSSKAEELKTKETRRFDRILVDAPCSGTGVIRRHPDIKWNRTPDMLKDLQEIQKDLLKEAGALLAPGGLLVYSVCSLEKEEGPGAVKRFLDRNRAFSMVNASDLLPGRAEELVAEDGCLRVFPGQMGMDGFFAAAMTRGTR